MYLTNITDFNTTNDYDNITDNCTITENIIDIIIPTLLLTIPCGLDNYQESDARKKNQ